MKKIFLVAGARPNFMKIAPLARALRRHNGIDSFVVHTGQHYDTGMSQTFFDELGIPEPAFNLEVGSASHAVQTANIMIRFEEICLRERPDIIAVVGDVNSTVACGLVAKKLHVCLAHVEAGLRSFDRSMPEEINRIVTDSISDLLFVTEKQGIENLRAEGHDEESIHFVGHVMIDNLMYQLERLPNADLPVSTSLKKRIDRPYAVVTMHRPSNVDTADMLERLLGVMREISRRTPIIFPCHPRTRQRITDFGLGGHVIFHDHDRTGDTAPDGVSAISSGLHVTGPLGYMEFLNLWKDAACVITDSGGLQEETTALKIPCITIRDNTERPVTTQVGSNEVVGRDTSKIRSMFAAALGGAWKKSSVPELWDGHAGERIAKVLASECTRR